jgi:hypothetical protein
MSRARCGWTLVVFGSGALLFGALALAGAAFRSPAMAALGSWLPPMAPASAIVCVVLGGSLVADGLLARGPWISAALIGVALLGGAIMVTGEDPLASHKAFSAAQHVPAMRAMHPVFATAIVTLGVLRAFAAFTSSEVLAILFRVSAAGWAAVGLALAVVSLHAGAASVGSLSISTSLGLVCVATGLFSMAQGSRGHLD